MSLHMLKSYFFQKAILNAKVVQGCKQLYFFTKRMYMSKLTNFPSFSRYYPSTLTHFSHCPNKLLMSAAYKVLSLLLSLFRTHFSSPSVWNLCPPSIPSTVLTHEGHRRLSQVCKGVVHDFPVHYCLRVENHCHAIGLLSLTYVKPFSWIAWCTLLCSKLL
jgi:hypothetical protein